MPAALIPIVFNPAFWAAVGEAALWTAAAVGVGYAGSKVVESVTAANEDANDKAKPVPIPDAATCATGNCPPPPGCKDLEDKINERRNELKKRYDEMREDEYDLYNNHKLESNPLIIDGVKIGSWNGHVRQFLQKQQSLRNAIKEAQDKGCPTDVHPKDKWKWASETSPSQPRPK